MIAASIKLTNCARRCKVFVLVENPRWSRLWKRRDLRKALRLKGCDSVPWDSCVFGTDYKKAERFDTDLPELAELARSCQCELPHEILCGKVLLPGPDGNRWWWKATLSGRFVPRLCHLAAALCARRCPRGGYRSVGERRVLKFWNRDLRRHKLDPPCERELAPCPTAANRTEWANALKYQSEGPSRLARAAAERDMGDQGHSAGRRVAAHYGQACAP